MCTSTNNVRLFLIKGIPIWLCSSCSLLYNKADFAKDSSGHPQKGLKSYLGDPCESKKKKKEKAIVN